MRLPRSTPAGRHPSTPTCPVALGESGLADKARDRIAANLARSPHDLWVRIHAGDALAALGDPEGAREHFDAALRMADESDDFADAAEVIHRLGKDTPRSVVVDALRAWGSGGR